MTQPDTEHVNNCFICSRVSMISKADYFTNCCLSFVMTKRKKNPFLPRVTHCLSEQPVSEGILKPAEAVGEVEGTVSVRSGVHSYPPEPQHQHASTPPSMLRGRRLERLRPPRHHTHALSPLKDSRMPRYVLIRSPAGEHGSYLDKGAEDYISRVLW